MESCWWYETEFEFKCLMAWWKKLPLSLWVFAIMLLKRLSDDSKMKRWLQGWFVSLIILATLLCSVRGRCPAERGEQTLRCAQLSAQLSAVLIGAVSIPHWDALSQYTFYGPWIESFQDSWWDPEFPQLSQMVQSLPGFLNLCLKVCSPSQVLWDVYTEVLEAAHPLHRGPTDHKRSVGPLLSLPEVHDQLFSFSHIQRETVVLEPWCTSLYLIQVESKRAYFSR